MPFILPILPLVFWFMTPERWRWLLGIFYLLSSIIFGIFYWRGIQRDRVALEGFGPTGYGGEWPQTWPARVFQSHFNAWLERSGWRILATERLDEHKLYSLIRKDRYTAALLVLRPGLAASAADLELLVGRRREANAGRACLVIDEPGDLPPQWASVEPQTTYLLYRDLPELNTVLGFVD